MRVKLRKISEITKMAAILIQNQINKNIRFCQNLGNSLYRCEICFN